MRSRRTFLKTIPPAALVAGCAMRAPVADHSDGSAADEPTAGQPDEGGSDGEDSLPPELGTDLETDTSGDGIPDLILQQLDVDPYRPNVFVSVDPVGGVDVEPLLEHARSAFAAASVENSDGSTGIDVHLAVGKELPQSRLGPGIPTQSDLHELRFGHPGTRSFEQRHRGHRHVVLTDDAGTNGWVANRFSMAVDTDSNAQLSNLLAAQMGGAFNPVIGEDFDPLTLDGDVSPDQFVSDVDWETVIAHLPETTPSVRYYEEEYAHLAADRSVEAVESVPADPDPEQDTAGDGIPDRHIMNSDLFEGASPLRRNIFFEVQRTPLVATETVETQMGRIEQFFAEAPIRNPDGSLGIDVHYVDEGVMEKYEEPIDGSDLSKILFDDFERRRKGYHYLVFAQDLGENLAGQAVEDVLGTVPVSGTVLHEIGHSIAFHAGLIGVDDRQRTFAEYPSSMNYNASRSAFCFSNDWTLDSRDDWAYLAENMADEAPATYKIDQE